VHFPDMEPFARQYGLSESDLRAAGTAFLNAAGRFGIPIEYVDLIAESPIRPDGLDLTVTALSDGQRVLLERDEADVGGPGARAYDVLHIALGHYFQWGSDASSGLRFFGDEAWNVATEHFAGADDSRLQLAREYEYEAHRLSLGHLDQVLAATADRAEHDATIDAAEKPTADRVVAKAAALRQFFIDWMMADLGFLMDYYRGSRRERFAHHWRRDAILTPFVLTTPIRAIRRMNLCVPLIRETAIP